MRVILYAQAEGGSGDSLQKLIEATIPEGKAEIYRNLEGLSHRLREPLDNRVVAILLPASREDLTKILSIQHLLRDIEIILLAPDSNPETIAGAHQLRPRFLTYSNGDLGALGAVLKKMLKHPPQD